MIELFFTCYLYANTTLKPGPEFEVLEIRAPTQFTLGGSVCWDTGTGSLNCGVDTNRPAIVTLKRKAKPGETIKPPDGCEMKIGGK